MIQTWPQPDRKRLSPLMWALVLSVLIHVTVICVKWVNRQTIDLAPPSEEPVEIVSVPPSFAMPPDTAARPAAKPQKKKEDRYQVSKSQKADNDTLDPDAKILGEQNQTVQKQTRARNEGEYADGKGKGLNKEAKPLQDSSRTAGEELATLKEGLEVLDSGQKGTSAKKNWNQLSLKDLSVGGDGAAQAASPYLDEVDSGERTILSTREFKYFSYFNRISDLLRQHWKPNIEKQLAKLWRKGRTVSSEEVETKLQVLLDDAGRIQKISRISGSGFDELDSAAIEAFEAAGPFPNPPKALIDADRFVRIQWQFVLKLEAAPRIQFRPGGAGAGAGGNY